MTSDPRPAYLPPALTTAQFAFLTQYNTEVIRRKCRAKVIQSKGRPKRIPVRELLAFGVNLEDAASAFRFAPATG